MTRNNDFGFGEEDETPLHIISNYESFTRLKIEMFGQETLIRFKPFLL